MVEIFIEEGKFIIENLPTKPKMQWTVSSFVQEDLSSFWK